MRATSAGVGVPQLAPACPRIRAHAPASAAQSLRRHASPVVVRITRPRALGAAAGGGGTGQKDGRRTACPKVPRACSALNSSFPVHSAAHSSSQLGGAYAPSRTRPGSLDECRRTQEGDAVLAADSLSLPRVRSSTSTSARVLCWASCLSAPAWRCTKCALSDRRCRATTMCSSARSASSAAASSSSKAGVSTRSCSSDSC
jgi:hypothetical protein